ncbi:D-tagatose-1,6-bisphosphate aldolase subunit KbaY [Vibrio ruber DSM 16370]|uniref:D-tagatose-1,6-bisphosphate aldolase subunit KbaY n=1 Tax=Vibrio ruber (strain DSM 16370 / JCM 11486 / BCRC 17186 / CECT 7878 / LMG 23124 / VR1) TaxID=1123498 RepID=A0A1R4LTL0_VIBR1|nr:class II fructose-bisphosphate aldolase [Vibrio ruber]SJN59793.1 D-tagatose-1,6-bisphosphate aldolase subunit KbaY [Vibrio ruber DSM 16370]
MSYVSGKTMIQEAWKNGYAIGAFTAHNLETIKAVLLAAEEEQAPIMIQIGQKAINEMGMKPLRDAIDSLIEHHRITVPVCVHLDHSRQFEQCMEAATRHFQSLMFDGSALPFEENIRITKAVVEVANALGLGAEGEIGKIGGTEDDITVDEKDAMITTVAEALDFSERTGVDYLAVSIGTAHGVYKTTPELKFDRLSEIKQAVQKPIVLHGGSGVPDDQIVEAVKRGVAKINVDTELRQAFILGVQEHWKANEKDYILADVMNKGITSMKEVVQHKIRLFGSNGKAK